MAELAESVASVHFAGWAIEMDDPLLQLDIGAIPGVRPLFLPHPSGPVLRRIVHAARAFLLLVAAIRNCDFVYVYCPGGVTLLSAFLAKVFRTPNGVYVRGMVGSDGLPWRMALRGASFALTTGDLLRRSASKWCRSVEDVTPMTRVRVEHIEVPRPPQAGGPFRLLYVGRLEHRKGLRDLLEAAATLNALEFDFQLDLVGFCRDRAQFEAPLTESARRRLRWVGVVVDFADLMRRYRGADAFVFPSHDEGFPRVLYEAMALGLPIVTTLVGSIPGVMRPGQNCLGVSVGQPREIAGAVLSLANDRDLGARLAATARIDVVKIMSRWQRSHACQVLERIDTKCP